MTLHADPSDLSDRRQIEITFSEDLPMRLTQAQVEAFHQNGYLVVEDALSDEDLNPLIADFEELD